MIRGCLLLLALWALPASAMARFALLAGSNRGSVARPRLWYAERDAERLSRALTELGEFPHDQVALLRSASTKEVMASLQALEVQIRRARQEGDRSLLVVFFSGHARNEGLELGEQTLGFDELKSRVEASQADVKVVIVDACEAGALTQVKGLKAVAELDFPLPADDSARGVAYIASTAVGEAAQESARLGGSFFTVHLETALRGAGDTNGDGQVTLAEAFQYTASRTVTGTSGTEEGPQHPTYSFKMSGRGDVVLSDLRRGEASLTLPGDAKTAYVLSTPSGALLAEAVGGVTLALPAGRYRVDQRSPTGLARGEVALSRGSSVVAQGLAPVEPETGRKKGDGRVSEIFAGVELGAPALAGSSVWPGGRLGLRLPVAGRLGVRAVVSYQPGRGEAGGLSWQIHRGGLAVALLWAVGLGPVRVELGPELGYALHGQLLPNGRSYTASEGSLAGAAGLTWPLGPVLVGAQLSAGARVVPLNGVLTAGLRLEGALVVGFEL